MFNMISDLQIIVQEIVSGVFTDNEKYYVQTFTNTYYIVCEMRVAQELKFVMTQ